MPAIFIGHGTPMNAVEKNKFSEKWEQIGKVLPRPRAILIVSAHWYTNGVKIMGSENPKMIYDMYGFPKELYEMQYNAPGNHDLAVEISEILSAESAVVDDKMGFDHGVWSILAHMYPDADIPVIEMSVDRKLSPRAHFEIGKKLKELRNRGIAVFASGNVVHNFAYIDFSKSGGNAKAVEFDKIIKEKIVGREFDSVINYKEEINNHKIAFETPDHFFPLLYVLGASYEDDKIEVFNDDVVMGALSMTGYIFR